MDTPMTIHQRMIAVMQEVGFIAKDRKAPREAGGYDFRGIDDFYGALQPALIKCGVYVLPEVQDILREKVITKSGGESTRTVLKTAYHFFGQDGDSVTAVVVGEGSDSTDKGCNKAMSSAFKYMASQAWCIPTDDPELDTEHNAPEETVKSAPKAKAESKQTDGSKEWYSTLKDTLKGMCEKEPVNAVCESILLLDKQQSAIPADKDPVSHTLLALLGKRGVSFSAAGPKGLTDAIGKDVLSIFAKYVKVDDVENT